jgi:cytidylate kinase
MIITIDGPSVSGKSTVARLVAERLKIYYLNTGLLFRAVAYILHIRDQYTRMTIARVSEHELHSIYFLYTYDSQAQERILFKTIDITPHLKNEEIDALSSIISTLPYVRTYVNEIARAIVKSNDSVVDGRDAGTIMFPEAEYKFFLTAELTVRAERWIKDQAKKSRIYTLEQAKNILIERDQRDSTRAIAPLVIPENAYVIDSTHMTLGNVITTIIDKVLKK